MSTKFDFIQEDQRIMEQRLRRHQLSKQEHQKHLKSLSDDASFGETLYVCPEELGNDELESTETPSENQ